MFNLLLPLPLFSWGPFHSFIDKININAKFKFTASFDKNTRYIFLDLAFNKSSKGNITYDLYKKSSPPRICTYLLTPVILNPKTNIPYGLAKCICAIIENYNTKISRLDELYQVLKAHGYPDPFLKVASMCKLKGGITLAVKIFSPVVRH